MKQGWEIKTIGSICDIKTGKLDANAASDDGVYPFFTCSQEPLRIDKYAYDCECVLIAGNGDLNVKYYNGKFNAYQRTYIISLKKDVENISVKFLYKFFSKYIEQLRKLSIGAVIKYIKLGNLTEACILVPPLAEQERIVEVLDREFEKIDAMKANAEQNLKHAKDLFQAALRQELQPKDGWKTKTIGEIAELKGGKRVPKGYKLEITPTGYPYIRVADFNDNGSVDLDDIHYISKEVFEGIKRYIITTNDVYISIAGTIGKSGIIPEELNGANLTENACRLVFKEVVDKKYIYYCTISSDFKEQIIKLTMQAAQPKLALARLATATLNLPSVESQRKIVARLDILNERCKALEENYKKTIALCDDMKQALLRKAFNGEL